MSRRNRKCLPAGAFAAHVESLASDGRGVARCDGKTVFIDGALPGEDVNFAYRMQRKHYDEGVVVDVVKASAERISPRCTFFGVCGGCALQHLNETAQLQAKQQWVIDQLQRVGGVDPPSPMPAITGPCWGYRGKARLGVRFVEKKGGALAGFRERHSSYLTDMNRCEVIDIRLGHHLAELRTLITGLTVSRRIPQVELAVAEENTALVFRHLDPFPAGDIDRLREFGQHHGFSIFLQEGGPQTAYALWPESVQLYYRLPKYRLEIGFSPTDFIQVNGIVNQRLIDRVIELLEVHGDDRILDLFCGVGNFSLPLARHAHSVVGVEGSEHLVVRARRNGHDNTIVNAEFFCADLNQPASESSWLRRRYDKILLDPPRTGAAAIIDHLGTWNVQRIVYVSCNPATLARDASRLVHDYGYQMSKWGVVDMFPHTTHIETVALFERDR